MRSSCPAACNPYRQLYTAYAPRRICIRRVLSLFIIRVLSRPQRHPDRHAWQVERLAQGVDQIPRVRLRERVELVAEDREGRRAGLRLRYIADLDAPAGDRRRRVRGKRPLAPLVQPRRRDAAVPDLVGSHDRLHEPVEALASEPRDRDERRAPHLRQEPRRLLAQLLEESRLVGDEVPFVQADDDRPPLLLDQVDDREVLLLERDRGVEEHDHDLGKAHGAQRVADRQLLELVLHPGALAQARGVEELDRPAAPLPVDRDRIAGDAGLGAGEQTIGADQLVDERRLAGVRAPDDRDLERLALAALVVLRLVVFPEIGQERVEELAEALAVLGRERHRLSEPQGERVVGAGRPGAALGFVGDEHHRLAGAAHELDEGLIRRQHPGARVHQEEDDVRLGDRRLCLVAHAGEERALLGLLEAGGVDDAEAQGAEPRVALAAVAGDARAVVDERELLADEAVEQGRLADVRPADDGNGRRHGCPRGALLGRLRRSGVDEGAVDLEPAAQRLRGFAVGRDLVEPAAGGVVIAPLQRGKAEHLARRVAPGIGRRRDALERRLRRSRLGGVEPKHRGAKAGEILQDGGNAAVGGEGVIGLRALGGVTLAGLGGEPEAGEKPVAGGRIGRQPAQDLCRFLALAVLVEAERLLVARGGGLGAGALDVLPIAPAADRRDDEHGEPDDQVVVAPPYLGDAVATILLVDLADEFVRLGQETDPFRGPIRKGGRLSQSLRDGERQAPAPGSTGAPISHAWSRRRKASHTAVPIATAIRSFFGPAGNVTGPP